MVNPQSTQGMFILALALPIGLFAGYIAYLIVPKSCAWSYPPSCRAF